MVERIQGAEVVIGGDSRGAEAALSAVASGLGSIAALAAIAATAIAGIGGVAAFGILVKHSQDAIDSMAKFARQTDSSVLGVQALNRAADLSGVSFETLTQAATRLNVAIGDMTTKGSGPAVDALKRLGIAARDFEGLDVDQKFGLIADRIKALNLTASEQQAILSDLGIRHGILQNLLEGGSEAFKDARQQVIDFGQALSDVDAIQIEQANDAMSSFREALVGIGNQLAIALAPVLSGISHSFDDMVKGSNNFRTSFENMVFSVVMGVGAIVDWLDTWKARWDSLIGSISSGAQSVIDFFGNFRQAARDAIGERYGLTEYFKEQERVAEEESRALTEAIDRGVKGAQDKLRESIGDEFGALPSEQMFMWYETMMQRSKDAADAVVAENERKREAARGTTMVFNAEAQKQLEAQQAAAEKTLESLRQRLLTAEELELTSYQTRLAQLIAFREQGLITEEQYNALVERNSLLHYERMNAAQSQAFLKSQQLYTGLANQVDGLLGNISNAIGREGKKQFGITKAIALAQAIVKGYEAIVSSYAAGAKIGGPPVGAAFAAIAAASTAAQIASLRSTNEGSSGYGGGGGEAAQAPPVQPEQVLTVQGLNANEFITGDVAQAFAQKLLAYQADGGKVIFAQ